MNVGIVGVKLGATGLIGAKGAFCVTADGVNTGAVGLNTGAVGVIGAIAGDGVNVMVGMRVAVRVAWAVRVAVSASVAGAELQADKVKQITRMINEIRLEVIGIPFSALLYGFCTPPGSEF